jgi:hypothetical protein
MGNQKNKNDFIGESLFIPMEGKSYIVYGISKGKVKLINYQYKSKVTMLVEVYKELKELSKEGINSFNVGEDFEEISFDEAVALGSINY